MKKCVSAFLVILVCMSLVSCSSSGNSGKNVNHVVLCWLKSDDDAGMKRFLDAVRDLKKIPFVQSVSTGKKVHSIEPVADNTFDVGFIITFKNPEDLKSYLTHPDHVEAVKEVLKPALKKVIVYDFEG